MKALRALPQRVEQVFSRPDIPRHTPDWNRLVAIDFETYFDENYTLKKLSTSEYVRDLRFKAQMMGIRIGHGKTRVIPPKRIKAELAKINWATHSLLCHNTQFDGFILSHHFGVHPTYLYDSLSMARGLHSNDIGAGLDEVSIYYGGQGKIDGVLEKTKGVRDWSEALTEEVAVYCANDVDEMMRIFKAMLPKMPADEMDLIDIITRMFTSPVLKIDRPRVQAELKRELDRRKVLFTSVLNPRLYDDDKTVLKNKAERALIGADRDTLIVKRVIGSSDKFADLLRAEDIEPPAKISPAWIKKPKDLRDDESKYVYAFAKDDTKFITLPDQTDAWGFDPNDLADVPLIAAKQARLQLLVDVRIAVKSTTNITRAQRFLTASDNGWSLPCGYAYYRAHTGRLGGNNQMNMQNLTRGGELRLSILAPPGHQIVVNDSGQIEARVNAWLWDQQDLLKAFKNADNWDKKKGVARGADRDAYCQFADLIYEREITTLDKVERFVGKVCLGPSTRVLTNHGLKSIIDVRTTDLLWDGDTWVKHDGLLDQGQKETLTYRGLCATPDHEVLMDAGWLAWSEVLTAPSHFQSALNSVNLPSYGGNITRPQKENCGVIDPSVAVAVGRSRWFIPALLNKVVQRVVTPVQKLLRTQSGIGFIKPLWTMTSTELVSSIGCLQRSVGVATQKTPVSSTMVRGVFSSLMNGWKIEHLFLDTCRLSPAGISLNSKWTGSKTTKVTRQATSDLLPGKRTQEINDASRTSNSGSGILKQITQTYDLANAGPNQRFTVMTDDGPVIVHNCVLGLGYQMGAAKLQITLAKGALGGAPVYFTLDQCKKIVNSYRRKNYKIEEGWDICKEIIEDMADGVPDSYGPISWEKETIWLPNGMCLKYPDLRKGKNEDNGWDEWTYQAKDMRKKIYGGLLCENLVQALARIIVMWQTLQISRKYRVVMSTHDEAAAIAKTAQAQKCHDYMTQIMMTPPAWCADLALNCEGGFDVNYSK